VDSLRAKYEGQDVLFYGLYRLEDPAQIEAFRAQTGVEMPLLDGQGTKNLFAYPTGVGYPYPRDVVVGKDLRVRSIKNSFDVAEMDALISDLLQE
jgi:hypothetical protein